MKDTRITERLEALLDELIKREEIHSAVAAVVSGNGAFGWTSARGAMAPGGTPMTRTTPWFIASITKLFIASTVLRMVEDGALALEDRLVDRLPSSVTHRLHVLDGEDLTDRITVEHLLGHASGLADFLEDYPAAGRGKGSDRRSLVELVVEDGDRAWSLEDTARWVRERLTPHFAPPPLDARRVRIRYSDTNYQLLVGIIEARRDAPFFQALEELILGPLDLEDTWLPGHPRRSGPEPDVAALYAGAEVARFPRFLASIADLNSTCDDLLTFLRAAPWADVSFGDPAPGAACRRRGAGSDCRGIARPSGSRTGPSSTVSESCAFDSHASCRPSDQCRRWSDTPGRRGRGSSTPPNQTCISRGRSIRCRPALSHSRWFPGSSG